MKSVLKVMLTGVFFFASLVLCWAEPPVEKTEVTAETEEGEEMRLALLTNDNDVVVEFSYEDFKRVFKMFFDKYNRVDLAFEETKKALEKKLLTL